MIPPGGFKAEMYPLRHRFVHSFGLCTSTSVDINTTYITLVRNYKGAGSANTIIVNPHHEAFETETGSICHGMSIIDKLKLKLTFNMTKASIGTDVTRNLVVNYLPVFFSFREKLDAVDITSSLTVASILELLADDTQEDVTPLFSNTKLLTVGNSDLSEPVSTANATETFGILNMDTDLTKEEVDFDPTVLFTHLKYGTNKGALGACIGKWRTVNLSESQPSKTFFFNKFVPRAIRRIVPFSFFGILIHLPKENDISSAYYSSTTTATNPQVGVKAVVTYDEWHQDHNQDMVG